MLDIIRIAQAADKYKLLKEFSPETQTWVVSDLQSKWQLQRELLGWHGRLQDRTVVRATELWQQLVFQFMPEVRLLSHELAQTLFWNWIQPMDLSWARSPQAVPVLLTQMQMWMSIFADPRHPDVMAQWFEANPDSYVRWGHWFELCAQIWARCQENNLVMMSWLPAVLLNQDLPQLRWPRELIFDLGPQISQVEGLLLREISREHEVRVIFPEAPWASLMRNTLRPYEELLGERYQGDLSWRPQVAEGLHFERYSTQLSEVKDIVARARTWLDAGVAAADIAVMAPDIEEYWPALQLYFREEGIAVNKPVATKLGSFLEVAEWSSRLRTALSRISAADLEMYFFAGQEQPKFSFDEFRVLFSHVYDARDLNRARGFFESLAPLPADETLALEEFLPWSMRFWNIAKGTDRLLQLLQIVGQEVPPGIQLKPAQWLSYLEGLLARREVMLEPAQEAGIWCVSISSAAWLPSRYCIFTGANEGALRRNDPSPVRPSEAQRIFEDTGFALGSPDRQELEFEFLWMLQRPWQELHLGFSTTDFQGAVQTPSRFWMWAGFANGELKTKAQQSLPTRWDEIQHLQFQQLAEVRQFSAEQAGGLNLGLERDRTGMPSTWGESRTVRISASSLERFWECPFVFAATRRLKLNDSPALDLDLDRRTRGSLLHALVEDLLGDPLRWDWREEELAGLVDQVREKQGVQMADDRLWPAVRAQHVRLSRQFLDFERDWRQRFPATRTVGREVDFHCYWDLEAGGPTQQPSGIELAGRIDRVDQDGQGRYALIDYKASSGGLTNWTSWLKNREIQLALYSQLLELGLLDLDAGRVVAANYYVVKDADRRKGFHVKEAESELYSTDDKHRNWISEEQKRDLNHRLREEIQTALTAIVRGELNPKPQDLKLCDGCSWRTLCRAPHLN